MNHLDAERWAKEVQKIAGEMELDYRRARPHEYDMPDRNFIYLMALCTWCKVAQGYAPKARTGQEL